MSRAHLNTMNMRARERHDLGRPQLAELRKPSKCQWSASSSKQTDKTVARIGTKESGLWAQDQNQDQDQDETDKAP
ncbi:hypothetical protein LA080_014485 [Diaporthe eres]|nr:hypothetical protein LA080_014485 [Diaporthe eres]